mgnify:FL=1
MANVTLTNTTTIDFVNIPIQAVREQFIGTTELALLAALAFVAIALMIIGARRDAVWLVPALMVIHIGILSDPISDFFRGLAVIVLMGVGMYIVVVAWFLIGSRK